MKDFKIFAAGVLTGIILASVGSTGILRIADKGIEKVKEHSIEFSR